MINNEQGFWAGLFSFITSIFKSSPVEKAEAKAVKVDTMVDEAEAAVEVKAVKVEAKENAKIDAKISKAKQAIPVSKLKVNKMILVDRGNGTRQKEVFLSYTPDHIVTSEGEVAYNKAFNWKGKPIVREPVVTFVEA